MGEVYITKGGAKSKDVNVLTQVRVEDGRAIDTKLARACCERAKTRDPRQ